MSRNHLESALICGLLVALAQTSVIACKSVAPAKGRLARVDPAPSTTVLLLETAEGSIKIELYEDAAPATLEQLKKLVRGPVFNLSVVSDREDNQPVGFYDGLAFDFTHPHIEIVTATREPSTSFTFQAELDADALGLDRQLVSDTAEAMTIIQRELLPAHQAVKKSGQIPEKLKRLLDQWYVGYSPDFLLGVSRKEINEALGYVYRSGLASRPATKGSVLLQPVSPTLASARLTLLLADIPERTGRWMVIGKVIEGLDVAQAISVQPRMKDRRQQFRPIHPVAIDRARLVRADADDSASQTE